MARPDHDPHWTARLSVAKCDDHTVRRDFEAGIGHGKAPPQAGAL